MDLSEMATDSSSDVMQLCMEEEPRMETGLALLDG